MSQRKVVIYARVSTEHEEQLSALKNQQEWYLSVLQNHPEWQLIKEYVDEGITGTSAEKRPQFMQMMEDAENHLFDLVLTREVSRFARNTVDTLQYTRKLKAIGVEVFFINDNIRTFDCDGELRLTIMATLAQEESRKTSLRVKAGQDVSRKNGVLYGNGNILGYDRVGKNLVINPEQAKTVRMIYDWYLDGFGLREIKFKLENAGRKTAMGYSKWHESTISHLIKNSFYCGRIVYNKQFVPDYLEQKRINNYGEVDKMVVKGTHEPIISEEEFDKAMRIMDSRRQQHDNKTLGKHGLPSGSRKPINVWTKLLVCECGHKFNRKVWHKNGELKQYGYQCYGSISSGSAKTRERKGLSSEGLCQSPMISEWKLQMMARYIFADFLSDKDEILSMAYQALDKHIGDRMENNNDDELERLDGSLRKLNKRLDNLIEMRADGEISRETFMEKKQKIESEIADLYEKRKELEPDEDDVEENHEERMKILKFALDKMLSFSEDEDIPENIVDAFVTKIIVRKNHFDWYLRFEDDCSSLVVDGKRKNRAKVSEVCDMQHRPQLTKDSNQSLLKDSNLQIAEFVITKEFAKSQAEKFLIYRILKWQDLKIRIFI